MTEAEWLAATDPLATLFAIYRSWDHPHHGKHRKLRLFACACCRARSDLMADVRWVAGVEAVECHADGALTRQQLNDVCNKAEEAGVSFRTHEGSSFDAACHSLLSVVPREMSEGAAEASTRRLVMSMLRDIFGNAFPPVIFAPSWRTSTVAALASQMYGTRDFSAMPILADALQEAGCDNEHILKHCRSEGPHVRGCLVVDLVLGKV